METRTLAAEILSAYQSGGIIPTLTGRDAEFDLAKAYEVECEFKRLRAAPTVGLKVGYANKAVWRALKLETLVWAHMYRDTVHQSVNQLTLPYWRSPKIEPEIVFKLRQPPAAGGDAAAVLQSVEWIALGFEIIDSPFPDWQFKPADFVGAFGLHLGLVVGEPLNVIPDLIPSLVEQLASFKVRLIKEDTLIEEGSGKNSLRSPILCVGELASRTALGAGDLISSGTLTNGQPVAQRDTWKAELEGLSLAPLALHFA
jgi:2-oxo-3-hexenedioate decarboxylase